MPLSHVETTGRRTEEPSGGHVMCRERSKLGLDDQPGGRDHIGPWTGGGASLLELVLTQLRLCFHLLDAVSQPLPVCFE